jgi:hypothetical protein
LKLRFNFIIATGLLFGILLPTLIFGQEGQPPYPPRAGKIWVWQSAHWEPKVAWHPGVPPVPPTPPPIPPRLRKYWRWSEAKWVLVRKPPEGPYEWRPGHWDPVRDRWINDAWVRIEVVPEGRVWVGGFWDRGRRIWVAGHWDIGPVPPAPLPPPVVRPVPPVPPPPPPVVRPLPPVVPPPPPVVAPLPGPLPPKPGPPRPGFHWEWDPAIKKWVQRRN